MLRLRRRLRSLAAALVVVLVAAPAGAVCTHAMSGGDHGEMASHAMPPADEAAPEAPPCHESAPSEAPPAPETDPEAPCASACCAGPASAPERTTTVLADAADIPPAAETGRALAAPAEALSAVDTGPPPPPRLAVYETTRRLRL